MKESDKAKVEKVAHKHCYFFSYSLKKKVLLLLCACVCVSTCMPQHVCHSLCVEVRG